MKTLPEIDWSAVADRLEAIFDYLTSDTVGAHKPSPSITGPHIGQSHIAAAVLREALIFPLLSVNFRPFAQHDLSQDLRR